MSDLDVFRQDLAGLLARCADDRRASLCGSVGHGDDLKIIALFERLAREAKTLEPAVFARCHAAANPGLETRCFAPRREAMLAQVGVLYWPRSAADLVEWMGAQASYHLRDDGGSLPQRLTKTRREPATAASVQPGALRSWASDFSAGLGIVAPMLSLWTLRQGLVERHERSFVAAHVAVPATVLAVEPASTGRGAGAAQNVVLSFQTPAGTRCEVTWHSALPAFTGVPGETVPVVPRSGCDVPLMPAAIGDPTQSFALAAVLMAAGIAALRLWGWLFRQTARPTARPVLRPAKGRRHDLA